MIPVQTLLRTPKYGMSAHAAALVLDVTIGSNGTASYGGQRGKCF